MNTQQLIALAHSLLPSSLWGQILALGGYLSLLTQLLPAFVAWGIPAATRAADWVTRLALGSPLRPLILWKASAIVAFLNDFKTAIDQIISTFTSEVAKDLALANTPSPIVANTPLANPSTSSSATPTDQK